MKKQLVIENKGNSLISCRRDEAEDTGKSKGR